MTTTCRRSRAVLGLAAWALSCAAAAHESGGVHAPAWAEEAPLWLTQALFACAWGLYTVGSFRVQPPRSRRVAFHGVMVLAGAALFGPLDSWAARNEAWHMTQHMVLIAVVAPLLVLARPLAAWRAVLGRTADPLWRPLARASRAPMACALLHGVAIWFWHAPVPYVAALQHTGLHMLEHACFLFTGWLFWWSVLRPGRSGGLHAGLALLFTATHTGMLGALLTFAPEPLYGDGQDGLVAQQLAGLVMWVPGGMLYLAAAVVAGYHWLAESERRSEASALAAGVSRVGPT